MIRRINQLLLRHRYVSKSINNTNAETLKSIPALYFDESQITLLRDVL